MNIYEYFQSYSDYFWQFEEGGDVLTIPSCSTIAYKEHILEIVEHLAPQGLPLFGPMLLAMIATNANPEGPVGVTQNILNKHYKDADTELFNAMGKFLKLLTEIPEEYKKGNKRIILFQTIFESCHAILSIKDSKEIVTSLKGLQVSATDFLMKKEFSELVFQKEIKVFGLLYKKYPDVSSILAKMVSLPVIPEEIAETRTEAPGDQADMDLVEQLIGNTKTFNVGSLIKRIWSGINIPFHNYLPSRQPLGGVSDLTNKGDFDKLLISEFANDDLLFLSRLANGEALYLNREIPPSNNDLQRIILIDISLKNWGTPRSVAFAVMLAIAKHPKTDISCTVFVVGQSCQQVQIDDVNSVIDGLQILEGCLHCVQGMELFFKEYPPSENTELFFISSAESLKLPAMQKAMSDYHSFFNYWVHTDAEGEISVFRKQHNSKKHLQTIVLPLNDLWRKKEEEKSQVDSDSPGSHYPILFRNHINHKHILYTEQGEIFQVTQENSLLLFHDKSLEKNRKGWEMVYEKLPPHGVHYEIGFSDDDQYTLLSYNPANKAITLLNLHTSVKKQISFVHWQHFSPYKQFIFFKNEFHYLTKSDHWVIDLQGNIFQYEVNDIYSIYKERQTKKMWASKKIPGNLGVFKNINKVFINQLNNLVFNIHELRLDMSNHILLERTGVLIAVHLSTRYSNSEFIFPDGSTVKVNRSGMLILESSNSAIPVIYIPSVVDSALGVATDDTFAGNYYYLKEDYFKIRLDNSGESKLNVIKVIKDLSGKGLKESMELADTVPCILADSVTRSVANNMKEQIEKAGGKVTLLRNKLGGNLSDINVISTKEFVEKYIAQFILTIQHHGTQA